MPSPATLVLLTGSYPYPAVAEQTFLGPELPHLARCFERVVVVPAARGGPPVPMPASVELDEGLASAIEAASRPGRGRLLRAALASGLPLPEATSRPQLALRPDELKRLVGFAAGAWRSSRWLAEHVRTRGIDCRRTVFYTYWLDHLTMGVALLKRGEPALTLVSRAHAFDLYEDRQQPPYFPCRRRLLESLDRLFLVSDHGRGHVERLYPGQAARFRLSRLGSPEPGFLSAASTDAVFRLVSCSFLVPVKRVDRLLEGLALAARARPERRVEWLHLGGGPLEAQLRERAGRLALPNLRCGFAGQVAPEAVLAAYRDRPVDLFANTSASEGIPVSIMEAQSCGIPVLAPAVGGIPEVVDEGNGFLLGASPAAQDVAVALLAALDDPARLGGMRAAARRRWEQSSDAGRNFAAFAAELRALLP
jgi:colanic acid/amylovoran biosynthesis glycosyltransferase